MGACGLGEIALGGQRAAVREPTRFWSLVLRGGHMALGALYHHVIEILAKLATIMIR